jgi:hypothetical protein
MSALAAVREPERRWRPLIDPSCYDRTAALTAGEQRALALLDAHRYRWPSGVAGTLERLIAPVDDALDVIESHPAWWGRSTTRSLLLRGACDHQLAFWGWDRDQWAQTLRGAHNNYRQAVAAVGYLLCDQRDLHDVFGRWKLRRLTDRVFGSGPVDRAVARVQGYLDGLGQTTMLQRQISSTRSMNGCCSLAARCSRTSRSRASCWDGCAPGRSTTRAATALSSWRAPCLRWGCLG